MVDKERILPFGSKDNFWEMGSTGPCGPCTEIHYDHFGKQPRSNLVNTDLPDLTELWNLVFIQYNKLENNNLAPLKQNFVDTGMGLERLVAILQGKLSNYDTDLFTPLFQKISKYSNTLEYGGKYGADDQNGADTQYRILADHARMVAVAIADNVYPDESLGLRRVIRKSLITAEKFLPSQGLNLVVELSKVVSEILGPVYPEITSNLKQIEYVLKNEADVWKNVQSNVKEEWKKILKNNKRYESLHDVQSVGLISAIKDIDKMKLKPGSVLEKDFALVLYDRYGLTPQVIDELAKVNDCIVNVQQLEVDIVKLKEKHKSKLYSTTSLAFSKDIQHRIVTLCRATDDSSKYCYYRENSGLYRFDEISAKVMCLFSSGKLLRNGDRLKSGAKVSVILDRTNYWTSLKSESDKGCISLTDENNKIFGNVIVENAVHLGSFVVHNGEFQSESENLVFEEMLAKVKLDHDRRLALMSNNMAAHLLMCAIRSSYIVNVQTFVNTGHSFTIKFTYYGQDITEGDMLLMEHSVNTMIIEGLDISLEPVMSHDLQNLNVTVPPYVNPLPNTVPLITFTKGSTLRREITTGPVVYNSKDIKEFSLVNIDLNRKKRECILTGLTGGQVHEAYLETSKLLDSLNKLTSGEHNVKDLMEIKSKAKTLIVKNKVPMSMRVELNYLVNNLSSIIKETLQHEKRSLMEQAITQAKNNKVPFVVHYSDEDSKLEKLTRLCQDLPVMVFAYNNGHFTSRCTVPETCKLNALHWMAKVSEKIGGQILHYKGHNSNYVCGMKPIKLNKTSLANMIEEATTCAEVVAAEMLQEN
ncbi:alanine--tRNA ligase, mitochondrial isoform X3 [Rhodnius prolixus]|uniref:alanine--tRNA ligase, mitochondrial isoform X3 n=1 Tax=Rhodnius prolixus TaxID=13249 RepID=UPI003D18EB21